MWSRFEFDGWQGHYRRARRWYDRLLTVANDWATYTMDEQIDFALVFFQSTYHLRDYLTRDGAATKAELDQLMSGSPALRICRDLCLGVKHRQIDRPSVDAEPWIIRTLNFGNSERLTVKAGDLVDLLTLAGECLAAWDAFLGAQGLDPRSLSPAATQLVTALQRQRVTE